MNTGIIKAIQKINSGLRTSDYNVNILDYSHQIFNYRDEGHFSKDVEVPYSLSGTNWLTEETTVMQITLPAVTRKS
ncbi:hypothetical protein SKUN_00628 [Spiroplasma kunkelii CR2-3x]|uniref:Uncharacterized protein n=1 Tax=Spiroplasma kunkelii CR2-3x TaxID=273035 RepID=A0A0K2JH03_SPIKU|nr:hypothetical protein [Spiroplasma kunkelii]ALA97521.1 hypothetical protein SKUN_00628 [Spiroplasma kunkelii CR2-3x]